MKRREFVKSGASVAFAVSMPSVAVPSGAYSVAEYVSDMEAANAPLSIHNGGVCQILRDADWDQFEATRLKAEEAGISTTDVLGYLYSIHEDRELIELGKELDEAWDQEKALWGDVANRGTDEYRARMDAVFDRSHIIARKIEKIEAKTIEGVKVKALTLHWCHTGEQFAESDAMDFRLLGQVVNELASI